MEILFEDKNIIVAVKPVGVASQECEGENMISLLREITKGEIYPVHRLDTVTSGVMVYAKNKASAAFLSKQITENRFRKEYVAAVHGILDEKSGTMEDFLFKDSKKNKSFVVKKERKGVKRALLSYNVIEEKENISLVKILLHTGRTHQIRVQFSSRKHPLYGDGKYGASDNVPFIALFSQSISFISPTDKKEVTFSAEIPCWKFR